MASPDSVQHVFNKSSRLPVKATSNWLRSLPSPENPYGIRLWPIFEDSFNSVFHYEQNGFKLIIGETPLSAFKDVVVLLSLYYSVVFCGPRLMHNRKPLDLSFLFQFYNLLLVALSALICLLFIEQMVPTVIHRGLLFSICELDGGFTDELTLLYYINYLMKYLELFDTVFLILKKKPLIFLHTYHHGATALLCWTQLTAATAVAWVPITLNLFVHVVMYWYYYQASRGVRVWWKRCITQLQITQFVIDIAFIYFALYTGFVSVIWPHLPHAGHCAGEPEAAYVGVAVITSYLLLFLGFYLNTYQAQKKSQNNSTAPFSPGKRFGFMKTHYITAVAPFIGALAMYQFCLISSQGLDQAEAYRRKL